MVSCYVTGAFPRTKELIDVTRDYDRGRTDKRRLERAFEKATLTVVRTQLSAGFSYVIDGMLNWHDLLRPFAESLGGVKIGSLARWFNNNTFYRKPIIVGELLRNGDIIQGITYIKYLPTTVLWKAILPAPYTFVKLSENRYYKNETELLFKYAKILREEIECLAKLGFKYVQLSDPALVYEPNATPKEELDSVSEALNIAVKGIPIRTCLQTFFGDFSQILPEALDFPVDHFGIDLYETSVEKLKECQIDKGIALGLVNSRSSLVESEDDLIAVAREIIASTRCFKPEEFFVCPNCDLEFLPWEKAEQKVKVLNVVAKRLREEFYE